MVRTTKALVRRILLSREAEDWRIILPRVQYAINSCHSRSTGISAFELFLGEKPPPLLRLELQSNIPDMPDTADPEQEQEFARVMEKRTAAL